MQISSLNFLPQSPKTQVPAHLKFSKVLHLLKFFTYQTIETLETFYIEKNFYAFDPHVGETSCQIRAYQIMLLAQMKLNPNKQAINQKIYLLKKLVKRLENDAIYYEKLDFSKQERKSLSISLENFITHNDYSFNISRIDFFLVQARILTKYKTYYEDKNPCIDYKRIMSDLGASKNIARQLIHIYQINLSKDSCDFILNLLAKTTIKSFSEIEFKSLRQQDDDGRFVLPCFWTMKIIYKHMIMTRKTIFLSIQRKINTQLLDKISLVFTATNENTMRYQKNVFELSDQPCFVIQGVTEYNEVPTENNFDFTNRLLRLGIEKIIFLNMAIHPQYSGKNLASISSNPFNVSMINSKATYNPDLELEYLSLKNQAVNIGCSIENASLFYIEHIHCDMLRRQIDLDSTYTRNDHIENRITTYNHEIAENYA